MAKPFWGKTYSDLDLKTFGDPSKELYDLINQIPAGGKVLDLGCGEGRNALLLAKADFDVTAIDVSEAGIAKLKALANRYNLALHSEVADMRDYKYSDTYDMIVAYGCLHFIERAEWQTVIRDMKTYTRPGGLNVVVVITDVIPPPADLEEFCNGLFIEGELFSYYGDWQIEFQKSYQFNDEHPGNIQHKHSANKLIAKKPLN